MAIDHVRVGLVKGSREDGCCGGGGDGLGVGLSAPTSSGGISVKKH